MGKKRYFLKMAHQDKWDEVTKKQYVQAERAAGFRNTMGQPDEPATAGFSNGSINGKIVYGGEDSDQVPGA